MTEELKELQAKEKEMKVQPDWEIDAFTKAQIRTGKRHSIVTDLILKLLGLDVSPMYLCIIIHTLFNIACLDQCILARPSVSSHCRLYNIGFGTPYWI